MRSPNLFWAGVKKSFAEIPIASLGKLHLIETRRYDYHVKLLFTIPRRLARQSGDQLYIEISPDIDDLKEFCGELLAAAGVERPNPGITDAAISLKANPKLTLECLKNELERSLFNSKEQSERIEDFLEEYHGARGLKLSPEEAFHFAQQRLLKSQPIGATP